MNLRKRIILILLFILFIPFVVNAENCEPEKITIESITIKNKSEKVLEKEAPIINGNQINLNIQMEEVGDFIEYKVTIKNDSKDNYEIDKNILNITSDYIDYSFNLEDNSNLIGPGETKTGYLKTSYNAAVLEDLFVDGIYNENKNLAINLSTASSTNNDIKNPDTGIKSTLVVLFTTLFIIITATYITVKKNRYIEYMIFILGISIAIPYTVNALCKYEINIQSNVEIKNNSKYVVFEKTYNHECCSEEFAEEEPDFCTKTVYKLKYDEGMTWNEWLQSDYNKDENGNYIVKRDGNNSRNNCQWFEYGCFYIGEYAYSRINFSIEEKMVDKSFCLSVAPIAECVSPESEILSSENKTIKAKDIKEGDNIAYYNFDTKSIEIGNVNKVYIHKNATNLIRYTLEDNNYLEVTDYHPIYTSTGWKSYTGRNGYDKPEIGDLVKTNTEYKKIIKIETFNEKEDYYDFSIKTSTGKTVNNYYANGILVQGSY